MRKLVFLGLLALLLLPAASAMAQAPATAANEGGFSIASGGLIVAGACIGAGLVIIGAGKGIGAIGSHAVDAIARQPEAGDRIFTTMIISAALIEGATLFALVICLIRGV